MQPGTPRNLAPCFICQSKVLRPPKVAVTFLRRHAKDSVLQIKFESHFQHDLHLVQATLLCTFSLTFCGKFKTLIQAQYFRNILVMMCRPFLARSILFRGFSAPETKKEHQSWSGWVAAESWIRVVYFTWCRSRHFSPCADTILQVLTTFGERH
jgi:hypothetical protein